MKYRKRRHFEISTGTTTANATTTILDKDLTGEVKQITLRLENTPTYWYLKIIKIIVDGNTILNDEIREIWRTPGWDMGTGLIEYRIDDSNRKFIFTLNTHVLENIKVQIIDSNSETVTYVCAIIYDEYF